MPRKVETAKTDQPDAGGGVQVEVAVRRPAERRKAPRDAVGCLVTKRSSGPRITRLMALAIKLQDMVDRGEVHDYADIARLGYVTRARATQIMNLLLLAPDIQEQLLFANRADSVHVPSERHLRVVAAAVDWATQRCLLGEALGCSIYKRITAR
jgi:hypothetical protein